MRIESTEDEIKVFEHIDGNGFEASVITLYKSTCTSEWIVGSSMCLPTQLDKAILVHACFAAALDELGGK